MCCELQQGVQLLTLSMAGQDGLQASIYLISQQVRELGASRSTGDEAIASQLRAFQGVLEATAASTVAEVTSALTALTDVKTCTALADDDLQRLSHACHASLVPLEQQNRALFDQMAEAQRAQDAWSADLVAEFKIIRNLQNATWSHLQEMPNMRFPGIETAFRAEVYRIISILADRQTASTVSAVSMAERFVQVRILSLFQFLPFLEPIVFSRTMPTKKTIAACRKEIQSTAAYMNT